MRRCKIDGDEIDDQKRGGGVGHPATHFCGKEKCFSQSADKKALCQIVINWIKEGIADDRIAQF